MQCLVYHASGERSLSDRVLGVRVGDRNTLKYRCPAAAYDLQCAGLEACERGAGGHIGAYGRIVRIALDACTTAAHLHPHPLGQSFVEARRYHRAQRAWSRINNRIDHGYEFEQHFIRGLARMRTRSGWRWW